MAYPHAKPYSPKKYSVDLDDNNVSCTRCMQWPPVLLTVLQARRARRPHIMASSQAPLNLLPRLVLDEASNTESRRRLDNRHAVGAERGNSSDSGTVRSSSLQLSSSAPIPSTSAPSTSTSAPRPSTSAPRPSTSAPKPSTSAPRPSTSAPRPSTSAPRPSTSASNPSTSAPKPSTSAPKVSTSAPKVSTTAPQPSTSAPQPSTSASNPSTPAHQTSTSASQPSTSASRPSTSAPRPSSSATRPSTSAPRPSTSAPKPSTPAPQPTTSAPQPSTSASNPSTPAPQPSTSAPRPSTSAPRPSTSASNSSTPAPKPNTPAPKHSTPASQPSTPASQPSTPASQPSTSVSKASTPAPKPSTLAPKPGTSAPKPSTPVPKPSTPAPTPSTPALKASTSGHHTSTSAPKPSTPLLPTTMTENGTHISDTKTKTTDMNTNCTPKPLQTIFDSTSRHVLSSTNSRHSLESTSSSDSSTSTSTSCSQKSLSIFSQEPKSSLDLSGPSHAGPRKRKLPSPVNENSDPKRLVLGIVKPEDVKPGPVYDPNRTPTWAKDYMIRSMQYKSGFIDTHCDVEMMVEAIRKHPTFCLMKETVPFNFAGVVAAISNPAMFSKTDGLDGFVKLTLQTDEIWMTFGCHPRHAGSFTATHVTTLKMALSIDRCVGVGPCGLNYTLKPSIDQQKFVFKSQLQLAVELNLPIVIHCKHAEDDCFLMMRKFVPRDHRIHVQGFIGSKEIAKQWMEYFSNMYFGITPVIAIKSMPQSIRDMVKSLPTRRMILEAGAPNIIPDSHKQLISVSHHGFALFTAKAIAVEKGYSTDDLFLATRQNTKHLYGI